MGFLPNVIGFNFSKQVGDVKVETRQSFWVTINDSDLVRRKPDAGTSSLVMCVSSMAKYQVIGVQSSLVKITYSTALTS